MHRIQKDLLALSRNINLGEKSLRDIGKLIGVEHPEKIKHHLKQLEKRGFLIIDRSNNLIRNINRNSRTENLFINIPIVGRANCGPAELLAQENIEGYLKVSNSIVKGSEDSFFVVRAEGNSMNRSNIAGQSIESGDYVVVKKDSFQPESGDYILAVVDGAATIKKFKLDQNQNIVYLIAESSTDYPPIAIHADDISNLYINGRVETVIKSFT